MYYPLRGKSIGQRILALAMPLLFCWACASSEPKPDARPALMASEGIEKLLVLPFWDMSAVYGPQVSVRSPLSGRMMVTGLVAPDAVSLMTTRLTALLEGLKEVQLISPHGAEGEMARLMADKPGASLDRAMLVEIGRRLGADAVMAGQIYRFRPREGGSMAVKTPASVAFGLHLIRVADGRSTWSSYFDETQMSLSENAFQIERFLQRGASWITAEEMGTTALTEMILGKPAP